MEAAIGHNEPPTEFETLHARADELSAGADRCAVVDQETAGKATLLIKMISTAAKDAKDAHGTEKRPHLEAGRAVDAKWKPVTMTLDAAKKLATDKLDTYQREERAKADAERRRLEEKARADREAAEAAAREGNLAEADQRAREAAAAAAQAETTKPAEVRSDYGQLASTRTVWLHEVEDYSKLPDQVMQADKVKEAIDKTISGLIRAGVRDIPGTRIWSEEKTVVR